MKTAVLFANCVAASMFSCGIAHADPDPPPDPAPDPPAAVIQQQQGVASEIAPALGVITAIPFLAPGGSSVLICPGVGKEAHALGGYGGWCDFNFNTLGLHVHCEWGGFLSIAGGSNCWRVFPGYPDHPEIPDPQIVADFVPEPGGGGIMPTPGIAGTIPGSPVPIVPEPNGEPEPIGAPVIKPGY